MFLLTIFVVGGVTYGTVRMLAPAGVMIAFITGTIAAALAISLALGAVMWLDDKTGVSAFLVHSWQFLSGVSSPNEIIVTNEACAGEWTGLGEFGLWLSGTLGLFVLAFGNIAIGLIAIIGMPIGLIGCIIYAVGTLFSPKERIESLTCSLTCLLVPLGFVILSGLAMRLMHILSSATAGLGC